MRNVYLLISVVLAFALKAQSPALINYQGVLRNDAGVPLSNQTVNLRFELRQGSANGTSAFSETTILTTSNLGLFSTRIGESDPSALAAVDWQNGPWFLAVSVDTAGANDFTSLGVQQLVSVPFAIHARTAEQVSSSYTNNVLTIAGQSYTLDPAALYSAGTGISVTGSVIANTAPDQTVTIVPSGSNVAVGGTYPNFIISSTATLTHNNGELSISDGNSVSITPTVNFSPSTGVLTVGPPNNTVAIPASAATTLNVSGAAAATSSVGPNIGITVPPSSITVSNAAAPASSGTTGVNNFSINIPAPAFDPLTGLLVDGTSTINITPTVSFNSSTGVLAVGPATNNVTLPAVQATTLTATGAAVSTSSVGPNITVNVPPTNISVSNTVGAAGSNQVSTNSYNINIPAPSFNPSTGMLTDGTSTLNITPPVTFNSGTGLLTVGPATNNVMIPASPSTTLTATGAAVSTSSIGPNISVNVPPTNITVTQSVGVAGSSSTGVNTLNINVPAPSYNATSGALTTGTVVTNITPGVSLSGNLLTVGPNSNTVTLPSAPTVTATGILTVSSGPDYTLSLQQPTFASASNASITGSWPNYTLATTPRTFTATGLANSSTAGNTVTIDVPLPAYNATTGVLTAGTHSVAVAPALTFTNNILRTGPASNTVNLSGLSPWSTNGNTVSLVTPSNYVGIGTSSPEEILQLGSFTSAQDNYLAIRTQGGNLQKAGIKLQHFNTSDGFTIESNEAANRLDFIRRAITSGTVMSIDRMQDRVGIGTTSPSAMLHLAGTFRLEDGTQAVDRVLRSDGNGNATWQEPTAFSWGLSGNAGTSGANFIGTTDAQPLTFRTGNSERMRFTSTGDLGIGSTAPTHPVHMSSARSNSATLRVDNTGGGFAAQFTGGVGIGPVNNMPGGDLSVSGRVSIGSGFYSAPPPVNGLIVEGRTGIGLNSPLSALHTATSSSTSQVHTMRSDMAYSPASFSAGIVSAGSFNNTTNASGSGGTTFNTGLLGTLTMQGTSGSTHNSGGYFSSKAPTGIHTSLMGVIGSVDVTSPATAQNGYAGYFGYPPTSSGATNAYGVYTSTITGTNKWSFYGADPTARSFFAGKVGIGSSDAPGENLQITDSNPQLSLVSNNASTSMISFGNTLNHFSGTMRYDHTTDALGFGTNTITDRMLITSAGLVGINQPSPSAMLDIRSSAHNLLRLTTTHPNSNINVDAFPSGGGNLQFSVPNTHGITFVTNSNVRMDIGGNGRIGINTTSPTATLHVQGTTRLADGSEGAGKVLTSDAQGNATWQAFGGMTAGMVMAFAGPTTNIPTGWLICDGSVVSRTTYSTLFTAIGTAWGSGTNTATFHLPDMRGMFLRGVAGSSANDPDKGSRTAVNSGGNSGNNVGSFQDDLIQNHTHSAPNLPGGQANASLGLGSPVLVAGGGNVTGNPTSGSGAETRPKNVYVYYIIKY